MMNRFKVALLAALSFSLFACVGDPTAPVESDDKATRASALKEGTHAKQVEADAGLDSTQRPSRAVVTIDGVACPIDLAADRIGLDRGLDGHGWAAQLNVEKGCGGGFILVIQGVDDAPYPQDETIPFLQEEGAILFTNDTEHGQDVDAGAAAGGVYRASNAGGKLSILSGPTKQSTSYEIEGEATVVSDAYPDHARTVTFSLDF